MIRDPLLEPILRTTDVRALEAAHRDVPLMERAGEAAAEVATGLIERRGTVVVLAGPGNNGGDAFVLARLLRQRFFDVVTVFRGDPQALPREASAAWRAHQVAGGTIVGAPPPGPVSLAVDGLFGLGLRRPIDGDHRALVEWINGEQAPRLALDIPSGIDADTGLARGEAVRATATATFLAWKPGLLTGDGPDHAGTVTLHRLGTEPAPGVAQGWRLDWRGMAADLPPVLRRGRRDVHKGSFGTLGIVGGATGMVGAALLAGRAALACGPGKVHVGLLARDAPAVDTRAPELMLRHAADAMASCDALVVGPGLGTAAAARRCLLDALATTVALLLDADALNLVAAQPALRAALRERAAPTLLTPHPAEAARLLGCDTAQVQADRLGAALTLAASLRAHVVVKGAGSVLAAPDGGYAINATGNPGLASGGSGDVLSGIAGALLAQGLAPQQALRIAVCVHGAAADALVARGVGPVGLRASELPDAVRALLNAR
jgi:hydroxyethylthiazole kinase-like uncharacterized protein yjeF